MCSIIGASLRNIQNKDLDKVNDIIGSIMSLSQARGRDGRGWKISTNSSSHSKRETDRKPFLNWNFFSEIDLFDTPFITGSFIANFRAEPTTEFIDKKRHSDQQPYSIGGWSVVHNGVIANDKELRTGIDPTWTVPTEVDSAAIVEHLHHTNSKTFPDFVRCVKRLKGSYAIIATQDGQEGTLYIAANYRPLWYIRTEYGLFFASSEKYLNVGKWVPTMLTPYTAVKADGNHIQRTTALLSKPKDKRKALVVCSGGLDSVVAAKSIMKRGFDTSLIHFTYGCKAEDKEVEAVKLVAAELNVPLKLFPLNVYDKGDSPLLKGNDNGISDGEAGAEFAHEWVPARNLVLLSVATAYAEAKGFDCLVLGNNLEEAGAYPDNEPEFINKFNKMLPFAVGDGKSLYIDMPVGNMMKHEIVAFGNSIGAPMHLTWSCYKQGEKHCGQCGPCYMRKKAFEINKLVDPISYIKS